MNALMGQFLGEESGATMVEYAIMVALIAVVAIVAVSVLGGKVTVVFSNMSDAMS